MLFTKSISDQFWRSYRKKSIFVIFHFLKYLPKCCYMYIFLFVKQNQAEVWPRFWSICIWTEVTLAGEYDNFATCEFGLDSGHEVAPRVLFVAKYWHCVMMKLKFERKGCWLSQSTQLNFSKTGSVVPFAMFILFITKIIITKMKRPLDSIETQRGFMWSGAKGLWTVDKLWKLLRWHHNNHLQSIEHSRPYFFCAGYASTIINKCNVQIVQHSAKERLLASQSALWLSLVISAFPSP